MNEQERAAFEAWWPSVGQTLGKVAAWQAWQARAALAATPAPALYVGLIERLMRLSTRLGVAYEGGVEHFAAGLEDQLYAICRSTESLLDSLAATPAAARCANGPIGCDYPRCDCNGASTKESNQ